MPTPKISVGVLPVFDTSGEPYSEILSENLTFCVFQELQHSRLEPVLLNPGGLYSPLEPDWVTDYGHTIGVDAVIITTLKPTEKPRKGDWTIRVEYQLMELTTGRSSTVGTSSYSLNRKDLVVETSHEGWFSTGASRPFDKQPLGHAAKAIAEEIRNYAGREAPVMVAHGTAQSHQSSASAECPVDFRAKYLPANVSSKAYGISFNGREESLGIHEGLVHTQLHTGPLVIRINLNDAPYKLPAQRLYQANTYLDCSQSEKYLVFEIGPAGEGALHWRKSD